MSARTLQKVLIPLRQIIRATDMHSKKVMRRYGLTIPQLVILRAINDRSNITVRTISKHVSLSQATVTTVLNRLEQRGLVTRTRSADHRRQKAFTLGGHAVVCSRLAAVGCLPYSR